MMLFNRGFTIQDENVKQTPWNHTPITGGPYRTHHLWTTASELALSAHSSFLHFLFVNTGICFFFFLLSSFQPPCPLASLLSSSVSGSLHATWFHGTSCHSIEVVYVGHYKYITYSKSTMLLNFLLYSTASRQSIGLYCCVHSRTLVATTFSSFCGSNCEVFCSNN